MGNSCVIGEPTDGLNAAWAIVAKVYAIIGFCFSDRGTNEERTSSLFYERGLFASQFVWISPQSSQNWAKTRIRMRFRECLWRLFIARQPAARTRDQSTSGRPKSEAKEREHRNRPKCRSERGQRPRRGLAPQQLLNTMPRPLRKMCLKNAQKSRSPPNWRQRPSPK